MVRINLLPERRGQAGRRVTSPSEAGQLWMVVVLGVAVFTVVVCFFVERFKEGELASILGENGVIQGQIDAIGKQISDHPQITARLKELRDREEAIGKLQSARTGPTSTLLELSRLLTVGGRGPTTDKDKVEQLKRDNPTEVFNANWDPRRLWLTAYTEADRVVKMGGLARDGEDVSELERRLKLSDYFTDVKLMPGAKVTETTTHQELFQFQLSAKVRY
jgi:type IV pilus assembly protein PilN